MLREIKVFRIHERLNELFSDLDSGEFLRSYDINLFGVVELGRSNNHCYVLSSSDELDKNLVNIYDAIEIGKESLEIHCIRQNQSPYQVTIGNLTL